MLTAIHNGSHYDSKALNRIWHLACSKAEIKMGLYEGVRHSFGCQLAEQGYSIDFIQDIYMHTSAKTTRRYAKRKRGTLGDAIKQRGGNNVVPFQKDFALGLRLESK